MTATLFILSCWSIPTLLLALYAKREYRITSQVGISNARHAPTDHAVRSGDKSTATVYRSHVIPPQARHAKTAGEVENTSVSLAGLSMQVRP